MQSTDKEKAEWGLLRAFPENKPVYKLDEIARLTGFSRRTVARMFENQPGVIVLERPVKMNKRRYRNVRVPRAVYERVLKGITQ